MGESSELGRTSRDVLVVLSCFESVAYEVTFHSVPFRAVSRQCEAGRVAREIVVVSVGYGWL